MSLPGSSRPRLCPNLRNLADAFVATSRWERSTETLEQMQRSAPLLSNIQTYQMQQGVRKRILKERSLKLSSPRLLASCHSCWSWFLGEISQSRAPHFSLLYPTSYFLLPFSLHSASFNLDTSTSTSFSASLRHLFPMFMSVAHNSYFVHGMCHLKTPDSTVQWPTTGIGWNAMVRCTGFCWINVYMEAIVQGWEMEWKRPSIQITDKPAKTRHDQMEKEPC